MKKYLFVITVSIIFISCSNKLFVADKKYKIKGNFYLYDKTLSECFSKAKIDTLKDFLKSNREYSIFKSYTITEKHINRDKCIGLFSVGVNNGKINGFSFPIIVDSLSLKVNIGNKDTLRINKDIDSFINRYNNYFEEKELINIKSEYKSGKFSHLCIDFL